VIFNDRGGKSPPGLLHGASSGKKTDPGINYLGDFTFLTAIKRSICMAMG
jgi:hypothetical protein